MNGSTPVLTWIDWTIIVGFIVMSILIGVAWSRRGRSSVREYFTSGASTPWWLLGTSMVATSFAADTPLTLAGWVVTNGLAQNWYWWCQVPVTLLGVFFIAALWRRANLVTDNEFVDLRYSGRSAAVLRGFKGLFFALVYNCIVMGWVNLAMTKIVQLTLPDIPHVAVVDEVMLWTYLHTPLSDELPPEARTAMRGGAVDPLQLYYRDWSQLGRPQRPTVMREIGLILKRFAVIQQRLANPEQFAQALARNKQLGRSGGDVTAELEKLREYARSVQSAPYLARLGLESREADLAARWTSIQPASTNAHVAAPAALQFVNAVAVTVAGVNKLKIILLLFFIVTLYTVMSGLWGVLVTDFIQFWIAMTGCIVLAVMATQKLGGLDSVLHQMSEIYSLDRARGMVSMIPVSGAGDLDLMGWKAFLVFVLFSWYVLQYTDGGSYMAQRMLAAKNERHAALGYLWYAIAHYCIRMWPWIVVGLAAAVMFPYTRDIVTGQYPGGAVAEEGYIRVMLAVLPTGWLGLLLAAFLAAYMSTTSSHLNLGASYLLNDFYRPFIRRNASERHYVFVSQIATLVITVVGLIVSLFYNTITDAWFLLSTLSAGIGAVYLMRWFWWRINAWTEMVCLGVLLLYFTASEVAAACHSDIVSRFSAPFPLNLLYLVPCSVGTALLVTFLTKPVAKEKLIAFVRKVQPGGPGWWRIEAEIRQTDPTFRCRSPLTWRAARRWVLSTATIYFFLFGSQMMMVGDALTAATFIPRRWLGAALIAVGCLLGWSVARSFSEKRWGEDLVQSQADA